MRTGYKNYNMPSQMLSSRYKTDEWAQTNIDEIIGLSNNRNSNVQKDLVNYDLYNGIINLEDFVNITNPYGDDYEQPIDFNHYDIISSKINLLLGEELERPFNFKVKAINPDALSERKQREHSMMMGAFNQMILEELTNAGLVSEAEMQQAQEQQQPINLEEISKYMQYDYKDLGESTFQDVLNYVIQEQNIPYTLNRGFKDALITGKELYWTGIINGNPTVKRLNPIHCDWDKSSETEFVHKSQWFKYQEFLNIGEIIEFYGEYLTEADVKKLDGMYTKTSHKGSNSFMGGSHNITVGRQEGPVFVSSDNPRTIQDGIAVHHVEWVSMRKIGFYSYFDEEGNPDKIIVDENFKVNKNDPSYIDLKWEWIPEVWEGHRIDDCIYFNVRPKPNQLKSMHNPYAWSLSYFGLLYDDENSESVSILDRMKPYQYEFNITMHQIGLEKTRAKGKKTFYDLAQLPSGGEYDWDMDKWLYYADILGIIFIDTHKTDERGKTSGFNQFKEVDQGMSPSVQYLFQYLQEIDYRCSKVTGITEQREGRIGSNELATNSERAVIQSSRITELIFYKHNNLKKIILEHLLELSKLAYKDGARLQYITSDLGAKMIEVTPEMTTNKDYGLFVSNTGKDENVLARAKQLSEAALNSGTIKFSDVIEILSSESIVDIKHKLRAAETRQEQLQQQQSQMEQQAMQEQAQIQQQVEQMKMELEQMKLQIASENNVRDNETKIAIAAMSKEDSDSEKIMSDFRIKMEELNQEKELTIKKLNQDKDLKMKELAIKEKELVIKRIQANKPTASKSK